MPGVPNLAPEIREIRHCRIPESSGNLDLDYLSLVHMSVRLSQQDPRGDLASFAPIDVKKEAPPPQTMDKYHVKSVIRPAGRQQL